MAYAAWGQEEREVPLPPCMRPLLRLDMKTLHRSDLRSLRQPLFDLARAVIEFVGATLVVALVVARISTIGFARTYRYLISADC